MRQAKVLLAQAVSDKADESVILIDRHLSILRLPQQKGHGRAVAFCT